MNEQVINGHALFFSEKIISVNVLECVSCTHVKNIRVCFEHETTWENKAFCYVLLEYVLLVIQWSVWRSICLNLKIIKYCNTLEKVQ